MMVFNSTMTLLLVCMPSPTPLSVYKPFLMLIGQGTRIRFAPSVLMLYILVKIPSLGVLKSNELLQDPPLRPSIVLSQIQLLSLISFVIS